MVRNAALSNFAVPIAVLAIGKAMSAAADERLNVLLIVSDESFTHPAIRAPVGVARDWSNWWIFTPRSQNSAA